MKRGRVLIQRALLFLIAAAGLTAFTLAADPLAARRTRAALAEAAAAQVGVTVFYDPAYVGLAYPNGDVPLDRGVCADVVIRALRQIGVDLQVEVHQDMKAHFDAYPRMWGLRRTDRNIDHRRVPNLMKYFERRGKRLPPNAAYEPGDIVAWRLPRGLHHIGVVGGDQVRGTERPYMLHNIGAGVRKEDVLHAFEIIGHYRW